jgi:hypothetical protein
MVVITKQFRIGLFPKDLGPFPRASTLLLENLLLSPGHLDPPPGKVHCSLRKFPFFLGHLGPPWGTFLTPCASFIQSTSFIPFGTFFALGNFHFVARGIYIVPYGTLLGTNT